MKSWHVIFTTEGTIVCTHCNREKSIPMPIYADDICKIISEFIEHHKNCKEQTP